MTREEPKSVSRWTPFADEFFQPEGLFRELGAPFGRLVRHLGDPAAVRSGARAGFLAPALDVTESADGYVVTVELPGVNKDDVSVEIHDNVLTVRGEKRSEHEEDKDKKHWVERTYGAFSRSIRLPEGVGEKDLKASFKDGVLQIEIPKAEETKPRTVSIK
ncbi:MAG: Hsp20/alpha crystallin family protein [Deltaproteobacteria bacterium]|nr:Hsp20/alpha crystallin family protein [Deltaproteobacteria bacterium]MBW2413357.1 Hsp20/alpha crystallin family protein [Deltaproteobacteria bacterium]